MGRATQGVRGINLAEGDSVIGMVVVRRGGSLLTATERGMGKRSSVDDYRSQRRGGKGLINLKTTPKTGLVVAVREVTDEDVLMLVTRNGVINRQSAAEIRVIGRNTQGVRLISLDDGDELVDVARVIADDVDPLDAEGDPLDAEGDPLAADPSGEADDESGEADATAGGDDETDE